MALEVVEPPAKVEAYMSILDNMDIHPGNQHKEELHNCI